MSRDDETMEQALARIKRDMDPNAANDEWAENFFRGACWVFGIFFGSIFLYRAIFHDGVCRQLLSLLAVLYLIGAAMDGVAFVGRLTRKK